MMWKRRFERVMFVSKLDLRILLSQYTPKRPWSWLHLDYAGPISGKVFLVLINAYSKWLDVKVVNSATSSATIEHLRSIFSVHGLPETIL